MSRWQTPRYQSGNFRVRVAGDTAECSCYGTAHHYRRVRSGNNTNLRLASEEPA